MESEIVSRSRILACCLWATMGLSCETEPETLTPTEWLEENTRLLENLRSFDPKEQMEAVNAFKEVGKAKGTQYILILLLDNSLEDYRVQVVLARILADWRDPRAIDFLLPHIYSLDDSASRIAAEGLLVFGQNEKVIDALEDQLNSPVHREREITAEIMSKIGGNKIVGLFGVRYLSESSPVARGSFLIAIQDSRHPKRTEYLINALTDTDSGLRSFAWSSLEKNRNIPGDIQFNSNDDLAKRSDAVARLRLWNKRDHSQRRPEKRS